MMRKAFTTLTLLAIVPAVGACGASDGDDGGDGAACVGAKCDDLDPSQFACKELGNKTGRTSSNVLTELHDPFAQLVLKGGDSGCPSTFSQAMATLRTTDSENCSETRAGLRTRVVTETGQLQPDNPSGGFRGVTTRRCGGRSDHELIFSVFGVSEGRLPSSVEVMGFDAETKEYNYYTIEGGEVDFHGSSTDILKEQAGRCQECHTGGGTVMKELRNPWFHWTGGASTPGSRPLVDAHEDLGSESGGSNMEGLTNAGNNAWNATRVQLMTNPDSGFTVEEMLKPLFCGTEFNVDTFATSTSGVSRIPDGFFAHCKFFGGCSGTHFGESGGVPMAQEVYEKAIADARQTVPGVGVADTIMGGAFIEPAFADIDYLDKLSGLSEPVLDDAFMLDVLAIDFTRPVFSGSRCDLLKFAPEWDDLTSDPGDGGDGGMDDGSMDDGGMDGGGMDGGGMDGGDGGSADSGNCCVDGSDTEMARAGCEDTMVESCVCGADAFCCDNTWDGLCVTRAKDECSALCPRSGTVAAPSATIAEASVASLKAGFIANLQAAKEAGQFSDGDSADQLLGNLLNDEDSDAHKERVSEFVKACGDRDQAELMADIMQVVTLQRNTAQKAPVMEFPQTVARASLNPSPSAHLDGATCELAE